MPLLNDALGVTDEPKALIYCLIRSWQAGIPGAYLLDGAHRDSVKIDGASQDAQRSGHPRPSAPTGYLAAFRWRSGGRWAQGCMPVGAIRFDASKNGDCLVVRLLFAWSVWHGEAA